MARGASGSLIAVAAALLLAAVPGSSVGASSLPGAKFGGRPGPPLLYADPPRVPELSTAKPFRARPLLVSGTDAYRRGEYLYQDYLFDDHGADTVPGLGNPSKPGPADFSPAAGDVAYPTESRFAANAADLVEFRVLRARRALVYRITLSTVKDADTAVVGIGVDEDRAAARWWPGPVERAWSRLGSTASSPPGGPAAR